MYNVSKAASGAIYKSDSHLTFGRLNVLSDFYISWYILESIFLGDARVLIFGGWGGVSSSIVPVSIFD